MKINELRQKSEQELKILLLQQKEKLHQLRFGIASKKIKNVREIRQVKKDIARILTLLRKETLNPKS